MLATGFPKVFFGRKRALIERLMEASLGYDILGKLVDGIVVDKLADMLIAKLSHKYRINRNLLITSASELVNKTLDAGVLRRFITRIVYNLGRLSKGMPVVDYMPSFKPCWEVLEFRDVDFILVDGRKFIRYRMEVITGLACGMTFTKTYPHTSRSIDALMYRLGVTSRGMPGVPRELVKLRFWGELVGSLYDGKTRMTFKRWMMDKQTKTYNRAIIKARRLPCAIGRKCACAKCRFGYDQCDLACRAVTIPLKKETNDSVQATK